MFILLSMCYSYCVYVGGIYMITQALKKCYDILHVHSTANLLSLL